MSNDFKRRVTSTVLAATLFGGSVTLSSCGSKLNNEVSSADKSASSSMSGDTSSIDKSKFEEIDDLLFGKGDTSSEETKTEEPVEDDKTSDTSEDKKDDKNDDVIEDETDKKNDTIVEDETDKKNESNDDTPTLGSAEQLINPNSVSYDIRSEYNLDELYVIDASLLDESLKGKKYITTTMNFSANYGEKNVIFVCYPSINSDFILVHQISFVNNEFSDVSYYSNISGGVSTDSNDMNTVISNSMIRPLAEKTDVLVLSLEEVQSLVKQINDENTLVLN